MTVAEGLVIVIEFECDERFLKREIYQNESLR